MAYTPINWQTGDTITAEKLNKMDNGWSIESSSSQQLFTETVTTTVNPDYPDDGAWGDFGFSTQITADTLIVTFDGTDYTCPRIDTEDGGYAYGGLSNGAPDFTDFPFAILSGEFMGNIENSITTASAGTYAVSASGMSQSVETSPAFETAVNSVVDTSTMPMECVSDVTTFADMGKSYMTSRIMFFKAFKPLRKTFIITGFSSSNGTVSFIPENSNVAASFVNGVFTVAEHTS